MTMESMMRDAAEYLFNETLKDGTPVVLRATRPEDGPKLRQAFRNLERETVYTRFFGPKSDLSDTDLKRLTSADFDRDAALLVTKTSDGQVIVVGSACYFGTTDEPSERSAEIAFTVADDYHGLGIASLLLKHLVRIARQSGLATLEAYVLAHNQPMLAVFNKCALRKTVRREGDVLRVTFLFEKEPLLEKEPDGRHINQMPRPSV
jgi:RimJ/RimL family protein N-acetyltransferase